VGGVKEVADGVWRITKGFPLRVNAYLVRDGAGVAVFDAGIKPMGPAIRKAADSLGGATRTVIGNAHADHRGGAGAIGAPVYCHADERADLEGDGGAHYFDYSKLRFPTDKLTPRMMDAWDDGPVEVAGTVAEGDTVGEFAVIHLPGHGPGCIGLWRERDRVAITNDCFALFDPALPMAGKPRVPHPAFNWSTERARQSMRKLSGLGPKVCWPGHYGPLEGDVAGELERAAG
jgi:glyoxylase-like metal-dependent hydrolase (beta-lactamase superfamily II)